MEGRQEVNAFTWTGLVRVQQSHIDLVETVVQGDLREIFDQSLQTSQRAMGLELAITPDCIGKYWSASWLTDLKVKENQTSPCHQKFLT